MCPGSPLLYLCMSHECISFVCNVCRHGHCVRRGLSLRSVRVVLCPLLFHKPYFLIQARFLAPRSVAMLSFKGVLEGHMHGVHGRIISRIQRLAETTRCAYASCSRAPHLPSWRYSRACAQKRTVLLQRAACTRADAMPFWTETTGCPKACSTKFCS